MSRLGVITGLRSEADCLKSSPAPESVLIACAGADSGRARAAAIRLIGENCDSLLSFGIAGGLSPDARPGTIILARAAITMDRTEIDTDPAWRERLRALLSADGAFAQSALSDGCITGANDVVATPEAKQALIGKTGAAAVDMESVAVAEAAAGAGIPFVILRVIADPADGRVPPSALKAVAADGRIRRLAVLANLISRPWDLAALIRLGRHAATAHGVLRRVAALAAPAFGAQIKC